MDKIDKKELNELKRELSKQKQLVDFWRSEFNGLFEMFYFTEQVRWDD